MRQVISIILLSILAFLADAQAATTSAVRWELRLDGNPLGRYSTQTACDSAAKALPGSAVYECPRLLIVTDTSTPTPPPTPSTVTAAFLPNPTAAPLNPERGFYVTPKDSEMTVATLSGFVSEWKTRLFLYRIALDPYRSSALPQSFLDALDGRFAAARAAGVKLIILPAYNADSSGADAPLSLVLQHIAQLKPILAKNADVIPFAKAGYVGAWGEWWGSSNGLDSSAANRKTIKDAILAGTPSSTIVHFTKSSDLGDWYPGAPAAAAAARVGFHNDCYLANDTDAHQFTGLTDPARDYVKAMTENSGFGGETCDNVSNPEQRRLSCAQAIAESSAYHLSWLNAGYAPTFLNAWKSGGCYAQIAAFMGYRLQLDRITHPAAAARGSSVTVKLELRNVGWARVLSPRVPHVLVKVGSFVIDCAATTPLRTLPPNASASSSIEISCAIPADAPKGRGDVFVNFPDAWSTTPARESSIEPANAPGAGSWDAEKAEFSTGTSFQIN